MPDLEHPRVRKTARKFVEAADAIIRAGEELKKARAALSLEVGRPPLKVIPDGKEGGPDEDAE
jgi:hypothetical protein